ncbi:MAG: hypothetical protein A2046_12470 [Bacteroidetes bacterium GWA2_30_7]|nr:MAG: hypothetical protein A2046_12470 [Bacteroidetes bacterium GWA2_30_7]
MLEFNKVELQKLSVNYVGNKSRDEMLQCSEYTAKLDDTLNIILLKYFLSSFDNQAEFYNLHHESDLKLNEIYTYVGELFENPENFYKQNVNISRHLYEHSTHPKIKAGEFYVVYFKECVVDGKTTDAIGLFKSENKDTFLKVQQTKDNFEINFEDGININKLDKGCLIFNTEKENGYLVSIVDNVGKGSEAQYWKDDFLHLKARNDNYHNTKNILTLCKNFVVKKLPNEFDVSKADQADLLNKSVKYFKQNESFGIDGFTKEVIGDPDVIKSFNNYRQQYSEEHDVQLITDFDISAQAVKRQQRVFKSVIKLDKNFHIYVHGNHKLIEKGFDEATGMNFYKVFFKEEN